MYLNLLGLSPTDAMLDKLPPPHGQGQVPAIVLAHRAVRHLRVAPPRIFSPCVLGVNLGGRIHSILFGSIG